MKTALITGITGQDGSYLAEFLLTKDYTVHGLIRRSSSFNTGRIVHLYGNSTSHTSERMILHYGDVNDGPNLMKLINEIQPDEIYNLAAQSHVKVSFEIPIYTSETTGMGVIHVLEAIRSSSIEKTVRFYQASSSEMYGKVREIPQTELTPFYPRSPYGIAKLFGYWQVVNYREAYGIHCSNGILFNHESPRRGETFVTRKITRAVAKIQLGLLEVLELGNLEAKRDWGSAKDYVEAMWLILQQESSDDWVISTGEVHSVREFVELAFKIINVTINWKGFGMDEVGKDATTGTIRVKINPKFYRPTEVEYLQGDCTKAREELGWVPKQNFQELVQEMVESDLKLMGKNPEA